MSIDRRIASESSPVDALRADIIAVLLLSAQTATDLRRRGHRWNEIISGIVHIYSARERYVLTVT